MALINFNKLFRHKDVTLDKEFGNLYNILNKHLHTFVLDIAQVPIGINGFPEILNKTADRLFNVTYENEQDAGQLLLVVLQVLFNNSNIPFAGARPASSVEGFFGYKQPDISFCKEHSHSQPNDHRTLYLIVPARYKYKFESVSELSGVVQIIKWTEVRFKY